MAGKFIHPQLVDDLSVALVARFNLKAEPKVVAAFINAFGSGNNGDVDTHFHLSGFPIGKIQSHDQFENIQKTAKENGQYFNVTTGRWMNEGNNTMVYGVGWCAKRNSPEHQAMLKIVEEEKEEEEEVEIDEKDGWMVVKDTKYIWSHERNKIVGRLQKGEPIVLTHEAIKMIKDAGLEWEKIDEDELLKCRLQE